MAHQFPTEALQHEDDRQRWNGRADMELSALKQNLESMGLPEATISALVKEARIGMAAEGYLFAESNQSQSRTLLDWINDPANPLAITDICAALRRKERFGPQYGSTPVRENLEIWHEKDRQEAVALAVKCWGRKFTTAAIHLQTVQKLKTLLTHQVSWDEIRFPEGEGLPQKPLPESAVQEWEQEAQMQKAREMLTDCWSQITSTNGRMLFQFVVQTGLYPDRLVSIGTTREEIDRIAHASFNFQEVDL